MEYKLREFRETDLDSLIKQLNNPNVMKWKSDSYPYPFTIEDGKKILSRYMNNNKPATHLAIEVNGEAVGAIHVRVDTDIYEKNAEISLWLGEDYWTTWLAVKATREFVEYIFNSFDVERIYARMFATNSNPMALIRLGFKVEAKLEKARFKNGEFYDEVIMSKLRQ